MPERVKNTEVVLVKLQSFIKIQFLSGSTLLLEVLLFTDKIVINKKISVVLWWSPEKSIREYHGYVMAPDKIMLHRV